MKYISRDTYFPYTFAQFTIMKAGINMFQALGFGGRNLIGDTAQKFAIEKFAGSCFGNNPVLQHAAMAGNIGKEVWEFIALSGFQKDASGVETTKIIYIDANGQEVDPTQLSNLRQHGAIQTAPAQSFYAQPQQQYAQPYTVVPASPPAASAPVAPTGEGKLIASLANLVDVFASALAKDPSLLAGVAPVIQQVVTPTPSTSTSASTSTNP